jgi:GAF domain-containing protein
MPDASDRLRRLLDAGVALGSELSLDALLQRVVETAAELTGARYAALGVIDRSGKTLERFLTTGIDPETHAAIGELPPRGRGILGVLIRDARPLRLHDIAVVEDDGRGFDPGRTRDDAHGLAGMRERLALVGGRLRVESADGGGTTLVAEVPQA